LVRIRLARMGARKRPYYRVVVADQKARRDGPFIEVIGSYDPMKEPSEVKVDMDKARSWLTKGAQPTDTVRKLLRKAGLEAA